MCFQIMVKEEPENSAQQKSDWRSSFEQKTLFDMDVLHICSNMLFSLVLPQLTSVVCNWRNTFSGHVFVFLHFFFFLSEHVMCKSREKLNWLRFIVGGLALLRMPENSRFISCTVKVNMEGRSKALHQLR